MFEDPELPDFDSMSQEELIEWLEELAKIQGASASEFIDDGAASESEAESANASDEYDEAADAWSAWLDETPSAASGDNFADADEETPIDLARFDISDGGPLDADAIAWLAEINAAETEEELPEITDYRPPEAPPENLDDLLTQGPQEDPLEWLDSINKRGAGPRLPTPSEEEPPPALEAARARAEAGDDFDDAYEDDETLDDLEDESLYTRCPAKSMTVFDSIMDMKDGESEEYSTQSMAPVPEHVSPTATDEASSADEEEAAVAEPEAALAPADGLTQAFVFGQGQVDLEAWYISRLRDIAAAGGGAAQPAREKLAPKAAPPKPPPPGLAAAIYSARGKVETNELREALADYETLLRTSAGLEWVVRDMRLLIARDQFSRNPSVHRVLGDALMRQGQLDAALNVYRHALTLL
ncbi:MAG: hypothetical protein OXI77_03485 [Chloroflexota bacterium]|nr:hypothetical protein [Chloroflexota bacterium]MDE2907653.1 hypothetical protein [Chloroflexota bacterium]